MELAWRALTEDVQVTHPVIARRQAERDARLDVARRWAAGLALRIDVLAVVVVGSVARGDVNKWSDLDVLVVADGLPADGRHRLDLLGIGAPPGLQPVGWAGAELRSRRACRDPIALDADQVGVVVCGALPVVA